MICIYDHNSHNLKIMVSNVSLTQSNHFPTARCASVSVDLDNEWAYLKTQGREEWKSFPGYLPTVVPRILELLRAMDQKITFFVVGRDALSSENSNALSAIARAGHEVGNHTFLHEPWLHLYDQKELERDFDQSEAAIEHATGSRPLGFRGPGFSTSAAVRGLLRHRGYQYDSSMFPTVMGPVARTYFMLRSNLSPEEKKKRSGLYGGFSDAIRTLHPYEIEPGLMEVPVTTMPLTRLPVHLSYLLFLAQYSDGLARLYWRTAVTLCRIQGVAPTLLLHPTDFLDSTDVPRMNFFPAMGIPAARKIALVRFAISQLQKHWTTGTVAAHARASVPSRSHSLKTQLIETNI